MSSRLRRRRKRIQDSLRDSDPESQDELDSPLMDFAHPVDQGLAHDGPSVMASVSGSGSGSGSGLGSGCVTIRMSKGFG